MELDRADVVRMFGGMDRDEKVRMLAAVAHNLTNCANGIAFDYREMFAMVNEKLLAINGLIELVTQMLESVLDDDPERMVEDSFFAALFEKAANAGIEDEWLWAVTTPLEKVKVRA